jgi:hypothetical protein
MKRACDAKPDEAHKRSCTADEPHDPDSTSEFSIGHPYGVKPWGNYMLDGSSSSIRGTSLGSLQILNDEALILVLSLASASDLCKLAQVSKVLYVFSHHSDLWRDLTLKNFGGEFTFTGNWKDTFGTIAVGKQYPGHHPRHIDSFYSDVLYGPWMRATIDIDPSWLAVQNIDRRSNLSVEVGRPD